MNKNTVVEFTGRQQIADPLTKLLRRGARDLLKEAEDHLSWGRPVQATVASILIISLESI